VIGVVGTWEEGGLGGLSTYASCAATIAEFKRDMKHPAKQRMRRGKPITMSTVSAGMTNNQMDAAVYGVPRESGIRTVSCM
jgi:hypothetical protein